MSTRIFLALFLWMFPSSAAHADWVTVDRLVQAGGIADGPSPDCPTMRSTGAGPFTRRGGGKRMLPAPARVKYATSVFGLTRSSACELRDICLRIHMLWRV